MTQYQKEWFAMANCPSACFFVCMICFVTGFFAGSLFTQEAYAKQFRKIQQVSCTDISKTVLDYKQCMSIDSNIYLDRLVVREK